VLFDADRLRTEVAALPPQAWAPHPNGDAGNFAVRLISVEGGENEQLNGVMRMTPHLERSPYLRQLLASFGVVWSRSRLLRLAPGEAWVFDYWRLHQVQNPTDTERIHLVGDTSGSASFRELVARSEKAGTPVQRHAYDAARSASPRRWTC
jgi:hypothetical protein